MTFTKEQREELRAELVQRLRSGKYVQGRGYLRSCDEKFCCLGVACDIAVERGIVSWSHPNTEGVYVAGENGTSVLPPEVKRAFGFSTSLGRFMENDGGSCLSALNDKGAKFPEIADVIESKPKGLFVDD